MERGNAHLLRLHSDSLDSILGAKCSVWNNWFIRVIDYLKLMLQLFSLLVFYAAKVQK